MKQKEVTKRKGKGVSLDDDDAIDVGLFSSGPATIKESIFCDYDYGGNTKPVPVWLLTFSRDGEEDYEQPYSLGKGWKISADGLELIPKNGQTGLPKTCNAIKYLVKPLKKALKDADIDAAVIAEGDPSALDGLECVVARIDQEKREGLKQPKGKEDKERSILVIEEVTSAPWDDSSSGKKKKSKAKSKAKADEDDDGGDDDADEEDDRPARKSKVKSKSKSDDDEDEDSDAGDQDDDEDETLHARGKGKAKSKSRGRQSAEEDDDTEDGEADDDDFDPSEDGIEAILEALGKTSPIRVRDLEKAIRKEVKGHDHADDLVEWATDAKNLKKEKGWSYDGKTVELD